VGDKVLITIVWDLTKQLPERLVSKKVFIKPVSREQLNDVGKILVITWGEFINNPETTEKASRAISLSWSGATFHCLQRKENCGLC